jgi:hypothetical protein
MAVRSQLDSRVIEKSAGFENPDFTYYICGCDNTLGTVVLKRPVLNEKKCSRILV